MAKKVSVFFCNSCGYESGKWLGQCPACHEWNTFVEETVDKSNASKNAPSRGLGGGSGLNKNKPVILREVTAENASRVTSGMVELDRVLGGGIVDHSMVLVGGDPGIGKSTLLLQMCRNLSLNNEQVLYISGEESLQQIKMRAERVGDFSDSLKLLCETNVATIEDIIAEDKPRVVIIDSIQTMYNEDITSAPGSVSQVRETTAALLRIAKGLGVTIFIVGHVTKEGAVAGPRVLEHMVDTVLYFEGDRYASYRLLRAVKNRFGSTNEIGVFEMREAGLIEVTNPSEYMLNGRPDNSSGSVVTCSMEGTRPILVEIQALVTHTNFGMPRRTAAGCDYNRVNLLMAVLEKRQGVNLGDCDAYVNVAGGIKMSEPAVDLGIVLALYSSLRNIAVDESTVCFGEIGLGGEIRAVSQPGIRVSEAKKLGFKKVILPSVCLKSIENASGIEIVGVGSVSEAIAALQ